jgi:hypothetical protein
MIPAGQISDHHQSWGYEDGPWKGPRPALLVPLIFNANIKPAHAQNGLNCLKLFDFSI